MSFQMRTMLGRFTTDQIVPGGRAGGVHF